MTKLPITQLTKIKNKYQAITNGVIRLIASTVSDLLLNIQNSNYIITHDTEYFNISSRSAKIFRANVPVEYVHDFNTGRSDEQNSRNIQSIAESNESDCRDDGSNEAVREEVGVQPESGEKERGGTTEGKPESSSIYASLKVRDTRGNYRVFTEREQELLEGADRAIERIHERREALADECIREVVRYSGEIVSYSEEICRSAERTEALAYQALNIAEAVVGRLPDQPGIGRDGRINYLEQQTIDVVCEESNDIPIAVSGRPDTEDIEDDDLPF